jgi:ABC-type sugar transport system permease subunit
MLARSRRVARRDAERTNPWGYVFIAPAIGLYLVFSVWPIFRGFAMAFTDFRFAYPDTRWDFNGLENFDEMIHDDTFWTAVRVTLRYTAYVLPTTIVIAVLLAVMISKVRILAAFYRWMIYLPVILPVAVTYLMFGQMFSYRFGLLNAFLRDLGVKRPPNWLNDPEWVLRSVASSDIWRGIGFPTLLFLVGIYSISSEIYEAAAIDGASGWQQFRSITLPLLKPVFALVLLLDLATMPQVVDPILLLTGGGPQDKSTTLGYYAYDTAFRVGDLRLGYASAINLVLGLTCAAIALIVFQTLKGDVESSGPGRRGRQAAESPTTGPV